MQTSRTEQSVKNSIKLLKTAMKKNISVSEACTRNELGRNYVSDVKRRLEYNKQNKNISKDLYKEFKQLYKEYEKN